MSVKLILMTGVVACALPLWAKVDRKSPAEPVRLIIDTDMYTDNDSGSLALAHILADRGECEILGVIASTGGGSPAAGAIQLVNAAYGRPDLPIGAPKGVFIGPENDPEAKKSPMYRKFVEIVRANPGIATYQRSDQAPDAVEVYRRILAAQPDGSVVVCPSGFLTNMRLLLESKPDAISPLAGRELVAKKVKILVAMACKYPNGSEYNARMDAVSSAITFHAWPTPTMFLDYDYGFAMKCALPMLSRPKTGFNPVYDWYESEIRGNVWGRKGGHPAWDEATVLFAVRGWEPYCHGVRGRFDIVNNRGDNRWTPDPNGPHIVVQEKMPRKEVCAIIDELLTHAPKRGLALPAARSPR